MRSFVLALVIVAVLPLLVAGQAITDVPVKAPQAGTVVDATVGDTVTIKAKGIMAEKSVGDGTEGSRRLNLRERTALGYTYRNVSRIRAELKESGFITDSTPSSEVALMVQGIILSEADPQVRSDIIGTTSEQVAEIDWDNLSRIIEMILEFLSKILPMFLTPALVG